MTVEDRPDGREHPETFPNASSFRKLYSIHQKLAAARPVDSLGTSTLVSQYEHHCRLINPDDIRSGLARIRKRDTSTQSKADRGWHIPLMLGTVMLAQHHREFLIHWTTQNIVALEKLRSVNASQFHQQALTRFSRLIAERPNQYRILVEELGLPEKELSDTDQQLSSLYDQWVLDCYWDPEHEAKGILYRLLETRNAYRRACRKSSHEAPIEATHRRDFDPDRLQRKRFLNDITDDEIDNWLNNKGTLTNLARRDHHMPCDVAYLGPTEHTRLASALRERCASGDPTAQILYLALITGEAVTFWSDIANDMKQENKPQNLLVSDKKKVAWLDRGFELPQRTGKDERFADFYLTGEPKNNGLPLPYRLVAQLMTNQIPVAQDEIKDYVSDLSRTLQIPTLSIARIERVLYQVIKRQVKDRFIADYLCGTPKSHSPAMNYGNYTRSELFTTYKKALSTITNQTESRFRYVDPFIESTQRIGSEILLEPDVVKEYLDTLFARIQSSRNYLESIRFHTVWIWHVLLILTSARVVSGLPGLPEEIDLDEGLWWVSDKEERPNQTYGRFLPLCPFLVSALRNYREHLMQCLRRNQYKNTANADYLAQYMSGNKPFFAFWDHQKDVWTPVRHKHIIAFNKEIFTQPKNWTRHFSRRWLIKANCPAYLIDAIYGHEKSYSELLNPYSSATITDLKQVGQIFEKVAEQLSLQIPEWAVD